MLDRLARSTGPGREEIQERLVRLVYDELKILARASRYRWRGPNPPGTTSLVHEAYLKLVHCGASYAGRRQFFAIASRVLRSVLVDNARRHLRRKRGGGLAQVDLQDKLLVSAARSDDLLAVDEALEELERQEPRLARIVECRCFGGLTTEETAEALEISPATVKRGWTLACAFASSSG
jgi:RNA polymerase sigma factor (TIGR02999 family)